MDKREKERERERERREKKENRRMRGESIQLRREKMRGCLFNYCLDMKLRDSLAK